MVFNSALRGILLSSSSSPISNSSRSSLLSIRHSHIGSAALFIPQDIKLNVLPYPPHPNPSRPLSTALRSAKSVSVLGPLGELVVPLQNCIELNFEQQQQTSTTEQDQDNVAPSQKLTLSVKDSTNKKQRSYWGLTRALLSNALVGVSEGHSSTLRLVGVGYRASVEPDPLPRTSKLEKALSSGKTFFLSEEQKLSQIERLKGIQLQAAQIGPNMRLNIRLGYSHPVLLPVPYGITATTPQPNRILLKGTDKEQLGLFASQIRSWRKPEPYKGKGIFVGDETIRLKQARKK